jgi:bacterioferritin-associated ferredoxin
VYVCSCFGVTEAQVRAYREAGAGSPREVASACGAGTDCGSCVRRIQALLGRANGRPACAAHGPAVRTPRKAEVAEAA